MPEFRFFRTWRNTSVPTRQGLRADNERDAFPKMDALLEKVGGRYVPNTMYVFRGSTWHKVPDSMRHARDTKDLETAPPLIPY